MRKILKGACFDDEDYDDTAESEQSEDSDSPPGTAENGQ